jgi:hypothetical protein
MFKVSQWPFTVKVQVRSQANLGEICGGQSDTTTGFSPNTLVFVCQYYSANVPHSSSATCSFYQKDKREKSADLLNRNALSEIGEHWRQKYFDPFCFSTLKAVSYLRRLVAGVSRPRPRFFPGQSM